MPSHFGRRPPPIAEKFSLIEAYSRSERACHIICTGSPDKEALDEYFIPQYLHMQTMHRKTLWP